MGPTASGKTDLAIELAQALGGELISVDSALVYRGLDIGSAKPDYPHHLVDICDPTDAYSAARFARDAGAAIEAIRSQGRLPILVGGTMLYFRALLMGLAPMPEADPQLRADIAAKAESEGWPAIHAELAAVDPDSAARIHPNHSQRLSRALEVYRQTGIPLSQFHDGPDMPAFGGDVLAIALAPEDRSVLHKRIARRFDAMLNNGFIEEVQALRRRGDLHRELPAIRAVGYRQLWEHLDGEYSLDEARERAIVATRQLAKRQFTWLRKWPDLKWIRTGLDGVIVSTDLAAGDVAGDFNLNSRDLVLNYLNVNPM